MAVLHLRLSIQEPFGRHAYWSFPGLDRERLLDHRLSLIRTGAGSGEDASNTAKRKCTADASSFVSLSTSLQ